MRLMFTNLKISITSITLNGSVKQLQLKILTKFDVIVLNLSNQNHNKLTMGNPIEQNSGCYLLD